MSLPDEEVRSIYQARDLLLKLMDRKESPKIPKKYRIMCYWALRHFPSKHRLKELLKIEYAKLIKEEDSSNS